MLISFLILSQAAFFALAAMNNITVEKVEKTGLPILYIETTAAKSIKSKIKYVDAVYSIEGNSGKCRIRGRGNTTWKTRELVKKPYLLKLNTAASLLGMEAARKWILLANTADKTQLRNAYALHLARTVFTGNIATPKCAYVQMFLNGRYGGLYLMTEKSGFEDNISSWDDGASVSFLAEVRSRGGKQINFESAHGVPFSVRSPKAAEDTDVIQKMSAYCLGVLQAAEDSVYSSMYTTLEGGRGGSSPRGGNAPEAIPLLKEIASVAFGPRNDGPCLTPPRLSSTPLDYGDKVFASSDWGGQRVDGAGGVSRGGKLDLMSFVDWYWVNELTKNHDAHFQSSCFMVWDALQKRLFMGPVWDFDISCGNVSSNDCENPEGLWICERQWFYVLMAYDEVFQSAVWNRWREKRAEVEESLEWLEAEAARLKAAIEMDESVYPKIGKRQWPHPPRWKERRTYRAELDYMKDFLQKRMMYLDKCRE